MVHLREHPKQPKDSLPAEMQVVRNSVFVGASMPLNREHNFKITISFGSHIFKISKENFWKHFAQICSDLEKKFLKNYPLHPL